MSESQLFRRTKPTPIATQLEHIQQQRASGLTQEAYCTQAGIALGTFKGWRKKLTMTEPNAELADTTDPAATPSVRAHRAQPDFTWIAATLAPDPGPGRAAQHLAPTAPATSPHLTVHTPTGLVLHCPVYAQEVATDKLPCIDPQWLASVLRGCL